MNPKLLQIALLGILAFFLSETNCKRIISVEFFGSKSHVLTYIPLLEELTRRGHSVTLLSATKGLSKPGTVKEIFTFDVTENSSATDKPTMYEMREKRLSMGLWTFITEVIAKHCSALYDRPDVRQLMEQEWDLVFLQPIFNECSLGFVHKIMEKNNAPLIIYTPASAPSFVVNKVGGHHPSSFVPNPFLGFTDDMNFYQRFLNTLSNIMMEMFLSYFCTPIMENIYKEKLGNDLPSSAEVLSKASLILSNGHFSLSKPKPNLPNVVDVGGLHTIRSANPLPKELEDFVTGGSDGFILFSFGTGLKASDMPVGKHAMILKALGKLKQRVVWKHDDPSSVPNLPKNVKLVTWMPQQDLLGHKNCKMFITHCGMGGTEEAIYSGVPLLGIPFFGDQDLNAKAAENHGFLRMVEWTELTEELLLEAINDVLTNPKYRENVNKLSKIFQDQIDRPLERGVWWVEYVLRHNGAPQLKSPARHLNFFQYHSWDVFAAFGVIIFLIIYLPYQGLKFAYRKCCGGEKQSAVSVRAKNKKTN